MLSASPPLPPPSVYGGEPPFVDAATFVTAANICAAKRDIFMAASLHAATIKSGLLHSNLFVANALLDAYAKCDQMGFAGKLFDKMPDKDIVSWTSLISGHCRNGSAVAALSVFFDLISDESAPAPNEFTIASISNACVLLEDDRMGKAVHGYCLRRRFFECVFVSNSLIAMYSKLGFLVSAEKVLYGLGGRNVVSWSSIISGYVLQSMFVKAIDMFAMMLEDGFLPNFVTMLSIIQACSLMNEPRFFGCVHAWISKLELESNQFVMNSLVVMYSKNGLLDEGIRIFLELWSVKGNACLDPEAMAAIIRGSMLSESLQFGRTFHGFLVKQGFFPCTFIENSLIDMYGKLEQVDSANRIFRKMTERDVVSWNSMISCCLKNNNYVKALELLTELHCSNVDDLAPDTITMLSSIQACAELASLQHGEILHGYAIKSGFDSDVFVSNSLIGMYATSGRIDLSQKVFHSMNLNDLSTWNAMILAHGIHGDGKAALSTFDKLKKCCFLKPNAITFVNIITACSHSGLVKEGYECFKSMQRDYDIDPDMEHYASVVNLFARSGRLDEAERFIGEMPIQPGSAIWGSLLGACGVYGDVEVAERAAEVLSVLEPDRNAWKVSLSNVYALGGRWKDAARVRAEMKRHGEKKKAGWSSIEVNGKESCRFMVGDTKHPEADKIYGAWNALKEQIKDVAELGSYDVGAYSG
ncbi:pentatricopeptide repeat-containing protein At3g57430, chloroplastic-like [Dendrobium catenatum]|uniref:Pentatricopeptide repeat-containing protein n=1 Tax=Dendrobium catenatum TaxID=906689 RepID=A0A2I0XGF8_9ASPA|nr:pentatricopeptide repeat-containing protein At3g57430, chloroplastic-like [Dendrobium catenatum]XP_028552037.1 pentatricopeptide repeat-containing protein At3g57430, chloroplastic-like [Dendrobium catenatum]PKU86980.1 Pentatricopeptide repeat-containing protein [Dendrobium catenatum]